MQPVTRGEPFFISTYLCLSKGLQFKSRNSNQLMLPNEDHSKQMDDLLKQENENWTLHRLHFLHHTVRQLAKVIIKGKYNSHVPRTNLVIDYLSFIVSGIFYRLIC
jgi:hypothetical protein